MTLDKAINDVEFNNALDSLNFPKAFSMLDSPSDRQDLFLLIQEEDLNPLDNFTEIPREFLIYARKIKNVEIPDTVMGIATCAFAHCGSLTSVIIPNSVTYIADWVFASCSSLTSIEIPDSITSISTGAFNNCGSLTSVVIPDYVTSIGDYAFAYCSSLKSVVIPDSVISIGDEAFNNCSSLENVVYKGTIAQFKKTKLHKKKRWRLASDHLDKIICADGVIELI